MYDFQIDKFPAHSVSGHCAEGRDRNVRLGAKALSQIYALQNVSQFKFAADDRPYDG